MDAVTEVLLDRSGAAQNISRMVVLSLLLHGLLLTALLVLPHVFARPEEPKTFMTITLGGAPGPQQGRLAIADKAVQQAAPDTAKPKQDTPPAISKPEMVEALKTKPLPKSSAKPETKKEPTPASSRKPTEGPEVKAGAARVETHGAAIPFGGLATQSGGGGGAAYTLDVKDFCCPDYLNTVTGLIRQNWQQKQGQDGSSLVAFTIHRDGTLTDITVEQGPNQLLNIASQRAIVVTRRVPPLPAAFTGDHLTVHLAFQYQR